MNDPEKLARSTRRIVIVMHYYCDSHSRFRSRQVLLRSFDFRDSRNERKTLAAETEDYTHVRSGLDSNSGPRHRYSIRERSSRAFDSIRLRSFFWKIRTCLTRKRIADACEPFR